MSELPEREALYHTQQAEWKALRKMRVRTREGGRGGGGEGGRGGGGEGGSGMVYYHQLHVHVAE